MEPRVVVYTLPGCASCMRARAILRRRGIPFTEIDGTGRPGFRDELADLTGRRTVPQVVIGDRPVGGAGDLGRLDRTGVLVPLARGDDFPVTVTRRTPPLARVLGRLGLGDAQPRSRVVSVDEAGRVVNREANAADRRLSAGRRRER